MRCKTDAHNPPKFSFRVSFPCKRAGGTALGQHPSSAFDAGRAGFVGTRNYELDSGAYFIGLLWNFAVTPGIRRPGVLLRQPLVRLPVSRSLQECVEVLCIGLASSPCEDKP